VKIVIAEFMDDAAVASLAGRFDVRYDKDLVDRASDLRAALAGAQALIVRNRTQVDAALLDAAAALKVVGRLGVGLDNIDVPACEARGIAVIPATGANALAVAEYVIGAAMLLRRGAYGATAAVAEGALIALGGAATREFEQRHGRFPDESDGAQFSDELLGGIDVSGHDVYFLSWC